MWLARSMLNRCMCQFQFHCCARCRPRRSRRARCPSSKLCYTGCSHGRQIRMRYTHRGSSATAHGICNQTSYLDRSTSHAMSHRGSVHLRDRSRRACLDCKLGKCQGRHKPSKVKCMADKHPHLTNSSLLCTSHTCLTLHGNLHMSQDRTPCKCQTHSCSQSRTCHSSLSLCTIRTLPRQNLSHSPCKPFDHHRLG